MKHAHVDATLTRDERAAPFRDSPPDADPLPAVTRLQCEIEAGAVVEEWDARRWLTEVAAQKRAAMTGAAHMERAG